MKKKLYFILKLTTMQKNFDVIIIGSGPAGEKSAAQAAYIGKKVLIVEKENVVGGACINTGTIPSKTLRETSLFLSGRKQRGLYGIDISFGREISIQDFMYRKNFIIKREIDAINENLEKHKVELVYGSAFFVDKNTIQIKETNEKFSADFIMIATGSKPFRPKDFPFDEQRIYDSDEILHLNEIPKSMVIVGAGVIGCEYACMFAALGIDVTLIDPKDIILPFLDFQISEILTSEMKNLGIKFLFNTSVESAKVKNEMCELALKNGEKIFSETFLYAAGRSGNTSKLKLENVGITPSSRGQIDVNQNYQTNVPNIYAVGDVIGFPSLASTSMEQGRIAMCHAFNFKYKEKLTNLLPYGIYTIPEISMVGLTEEEAKKKNINYEIGVSRYGDNVRGKIIGNENGFLKLLFSKEDKKLLGVHIIGENASELVHTGMLTMYFDGTIDAFIQNVFNYPTLSDIYKYAAYDGLGNLSGKKLKK